MLYLFDSYCLKSVIGTKGRMKAENRVCRKQGFERHADVKVCSVLWLFTFRVKSILVAKLSNDFHLPRSNVSQNYYHSKQIRRTIVTA